MPKLWIANATSQVQQFTYWLPEMPRSFVQEVPIGSQTMIAGKDLPQSAIDGILKQHEIYGLASANQAFRQRKFSGVVYSIDKPVRLDILQELVNHHRGVLTERGKQLRQEAAIATDDYIQNQMMDQQMPGRLQELEMLVEETERDQRDDSPEVAEGTRVSHREADDKAPPRRRRATRNKIAS